MSAKNSLLHTICPLVNLSLFFGLFPCRVVSVSGVQKLQSRSCYVVYSVTVSLVLAGCFQWAVFELIKMRSWVKLESITAFAGFVQIYGLFIVGIISMVSGWLARGKSMTIIQRIQSVDAEIEKLNIMLNYRGKRRHLLLQLLGLSLIPFGASMVNCFVINHKASASFLCYFFICFSPILLITLKEVHYYNAVLLIRQKIQIVNKCLLTFNKHSVKYHLERSIATQVQPVANNGAPKRLDSLLRLKEIHAELMDILQEIQVIFGPHLLASILMAVVIITTQLYYLFTGLINQLDYSVLMILMTIIWVGLQMLLIMVNVVVCTRTCDVIFKTGQILHCISGTSEDDNLYRIVQLFSMQILVRKCNFTAVGFIKLDNKFVTSVIAAVFTYLVVMLQFHHSGSNQHPTTNQLW